LGFGFLSGKIRVQACTSGGILPRTIINMLEAVLNNNNVNKQIKVGGTSGAMQLPQMT
jgi:hypothetical protein